MATYTCAFQIPAANSTQGSKLIGGFPGATAPTLQKDDQLQVTVKFLGQSAPTSLNGYMIISPLPAATSQTTPSPFLSGAGNPLCFKPESGVSGDSSNTFTFSPLTYNGGYQGQYELTFVAESPSGVQWSEDPEFDTGA